MGNRDSRLSREGTQRTERSTQDREVSQDHELTDQERLDALRRSYFAQALPDLPKIPGYHTIWLTTTNSRDPISGRIRLGYEPLSAADFPGWEHAALKTGDYMGFIGVNEMLAFKLPMRLYEMYMREAHHDAPNREEEKLNATIDTIAQEAERRKAKVIVEEGSQELGRGPLRPKFEGTSLE